MLKKTSLCILICCNCSIAFTQSLSLTTDRKTIVPQPQSEQMLPLTLGLRKEMISGLGLSIGSDYILKEDLKTIPKKKGKANKYRTVSQHVGLNFSFASKGISYNAIGLKAEHFFRRSTSKGFVTQIGYGIGLQRNQYKGDLAENAPSGRTYWSPSLRVGWGYDLNKKWGGNGIVMVHFQTAWLFKSFQKYGADNLAEITYSRPIFNF